MIGYHSSVGSGSCGFSVAMPSVELQDDKYQILSIVLKGGSQSARHCEWRQSYSVDREAGARPG